VQGRPKTQGIGKLREGLGKGGLGKGKTQDRTMVQEGAQKVLTTKSWVKRKLGKGGGTKTGNWGPRKIGDFEEKIMGQNNYKSIRVLGQLKGPEVGNLGRNH